MLVKLTSKVEEKKRWLRMNVMLSLLRCRIYDPPRRRPNRCIKPKGSLYARGLKHTARQMRLCGTRTSQKTYQNLYFWTNLACFGALLVTSGPRKLFSIELRPAEHCCFGMWPSDQIEFETPALRLRLHYITLLYSFLHFFLSTTQQRCCLFICILLLFSYPFFPDIISQIFLLFNISIFVSNGFLNIFFGVTCPFWMSSLFSFFCHQVVLLIHLVFWWTPESNSFLRTMAQTVSPRSSPLDQGAFQTVSNGLRQNQFMSLSLNLENGSFMNCVIFVLHFW